MKKKRLLLLGILAVLVLAALIYTRPMTLEAMFGLDITQSELVYTDYLTVSIDEPGRSVESSEWPRGEERTENADCTSLAAEIPPLAPKPPAVGDNERYAAE